ncbi:MAG TPA: energy transducer TonB [Candidatus Angelobacter sp.]|nr:energy transducer TonB [Candidatus Angelobacter sp.]
MDLRFDQDHQAWATLAQVRPARRWRWSSSLATSLGIHVVILTILCLPAAPIFIRPRLIAHGEGGNATPTSVMLYLPNDIQLAAQNTQALLSLPTEPHKKPQKSRVKKRTNTLEVEKPSGSLEAGSQLGSGYDGPASGDEIKPALPDTFPDLKIPQSELGGVTGDVVVEVTIDAQGAVVQEKLLQGLGHGVDERVIAVLHDWHFRPATRNGVPIPSKHDVYFHFPS